MTLRRKPRLGPQSFDLPIVLQSAQGAHTFPGEVVSSLRHLENTLLYNNALPTSLALVAALSGEGVTYTSLALAATLANDLRARICVVELNWYAPGLLARLSEPVVAQPRRRKKRAALPVLPDFGSSLGLADVLNGECSLDAALITTETPNLSLLPAGTLPAAQRPALARSDALKHCLAQLGARFDHLVLDIPAIHTTSDAVALASLAQACCIVVRQGITPASSVRGALDGLVHLQMLGAILNQVSSDVPRWIHALVPQE